jgi:hypothetical protein
MTTSISKNTISENVWKNFYDLMKNNVKTVSITGPKTITVQSYVAAYSDKMLDTKSDYPILVVNTPELSYEALSFRDTLVNGTIAIEIFTIQAESADKFKDLINKTLQDNYNALQGVELDEIQLDADVSDFFERSGMKIHHRTVTWRYEFHFT